MPKAGAPKNKKRTTRLWTSAGCQPLRDMYLWAEAEKPTSWTAVQEQFIKAMGDFDTLVASGGATQADWQNGKGDFFNDLIELILQKAAQVELVRRPGVPGVVFPDNNLDVAYPSDGLARFTVETKAVGNPRHPRNENSQKNPLGRPGRTDLDKRIKEAGFKTIDLKAEFGRRSLAAGKPGDEIGGDLTRWLRTVPPVSCLFIAARVVDDGDRAAVEGFAHKAAHIFDFVGIVCFQPKSLKEPTNYKIAKLADPGVELSRSLSRAANELRRIKSAYEAELGV